MKREVLRMDRVTFRENGVTLLDNFNLQIFSGEIMGLILLGGHATEALIALLQQNLPLHYGKVYYRDELVNTYQYAGKPTRNRVAVIEKQSRLVEGMTVADNVFVLRKGFGKYLIRPRVLAGQLRMLSQELGVDIPADVRVETLPFFERCVVEVFKAVVAGARLIAVRDISNFVTADDLSRIHRIMRHYAAAGIAFLYVCNHHEETFSVCDRAALMQDGSILKVLEQRDMTDAVMLPFAEPFAREVRNRWQHEAAARAAHPEDSAPGDAAVAFENVWSGTLRGLTFSALPGECVVLHDTDKSLMDALRGVISGEERPYAGRVTLGGRPLPRGAAGRRALAFISEKPARTMLFYDMNCLDNLCFCVDHRMSGVWRRRGIGRSLVAELSPLLEGIAERELHELTADELYTLVYTRVLLQKPRAVFCVQPFSGADMQLRMHIMHLLQRLLDRGIAVIILAVSLSDSLALAQRLLVVEQGAVKETYWPDTFSLLPDASPWKQHSVEE